MIVVVGERHTTFVAFFDFAHVILEALQLAESHLRGSPHHHAASGLGAAFDGLRVIIQPATLPTLVIEKTSRISA